MCHYTSNTPILCILSLILDLLTRICAGQYGHISALLCLKQTPSSHSTFVIVLKANITSLDDLSQVYM